MFSPIAPIAVQEKMARDFHGYNLLLAHEVLAHKPKYIDYYSQWINADTFIIMDNSIIELGSPLPADQLIEAASIVKAKCIVLPDRLGDALGTVHDSTAAANTTPLPPNMHWMGVVQGSTVDEALWCAECLWAIPGVRYLSVPKIIADKNKEHSRWKYLESLRKIVGDRRCVHLLGFSNYLLDDMVCANHPLVMGIDSATPIWFGNNRGVLPLHLDKKNIKYEFGKRPKDFWEMSPEKGDFVPEMSLNCERVRDWIRMNIFYVK